MLAINGLWLLGSDLFRLLGHSFRHSIPCRIGFGSGFRCSGVCRLQIGQAVFPVAVVLDNVQALLAGDVGAIEDGDCLDFLVWLRFGCGRLFGFIDGGLIGLPEIRPGAHHTAKALLSFNDSIYLAKHIQGAFPVHCQRILQRLGGPWPESGLIHARILHCSYSAGNGGHVALKLFIAGTICRLAVIAGLLLACAGRLNGILNSQLCLLQP